MLDQRQSRALDKTRPHRVERDVAQRRGEVRLVHDHGAEPALPEMAAALAPRMDDAGITAVHGGERPAQAVGIRRRQDEVDMVGHWRSCAT
jgi:hypothetical protein